MTPAIRIGVAGLGTVGIGVLRLLSQHADLLARRCGRRLVVDAVSARDRSRDRGVDLSSVRWFDDAAALAEDPRLDVVLELIGGAEGTGRKVVERALACGKPVVTANKALLAVHGGDLVPAAERQGVALAFEGAVAGGLPIVKTLREGLVANSLDSVVGILNGTCNYILTQMRESGRDFAEVLAEAQALGYAEADPSFDVDGIDAAHKLAILAALAFNGRVDFAGVMVEGIREISALDINFAEILGYRIKLLGIARRGADGRVALRVHPAMIAPSKPIASVEGVLNAVVAHGSPVGSVMSVGPGAGAGPTASAVVADLVDVVRGHKAPGFGAPADGMAPLAVAPPDARVGAYYLRLMVVDRPGVIADIAAAMRDHTISVESLVQRGRAPGEAVPVVIVTHDTLERQMLGAVARIAELDAVLEPPRLIRIEKMDD